MRVFAVSDVHVDYEANMRWLLDLPSDELTQDILILAGDLTDNLARIEQCFRSLVKKFRKVLFVPGNHELWVVRDDIEDSFQKFQRVLEVCADCGVSTEVYSHGPVSVVPLMGWYDFSFGLPSTELKRCWSDFKACSWAGYTERAVTNYFTDKNVPRLDATNDVVISFSHFLPRIDLMPAFIPPSQRFLYPVLGSSLLAEQINTLKPTTHVYGHSHVNRQVTIEGVRYINNAFGYPSETRIARKMLLCVYGADS